MDSDVNAVMKSSLYCTATVLDASVVRAILGHANGIIHPGCKSRNTSRELLS